jgi:RP/EB family microtubule-associated protein
MTRPDVVQVYATLASGTNMSRNELLDWVNMCIYSKFTKVEELHTGVAYACLLSIHFPGWILLDKLKFDCRDLSDVTANWNLVTDAFSSLGIRKNVPVNDLIKGKYKVSCSFI